MEVRGDTLIVEVVSSAWLAELSMMRGLILDRVNAVRTGPAIGKIRFRLARNPKNAPGERRAGARASTGARAKWQKRRSKSGDR